MLILMLTGVALLSCNADERLQGYRPPPLQPVGIARPVLSSLQAPPGSRIAIAIEAIPTGGDTLSGVQGVLTFDPLKVVYVGQAPYDSLTFPLVIVNSTDAATGTLRILSVDPAGLAVQSAVLAFDVLATDYAGSVRYTLEMAATVSLTVLNGDGSPSAAALDPSVVVPSAAVRLTPQDWTRMQNDHATASARLIDSIPAGRRFGDVNGSGAVDVLDASRVGNWAVGNPSPAGTPIPAPGDLTELVGNVGPNNLPGLGGATDPKGPGWDPNCVRLWDVLDASAISNEAVGNDRAVVGEFIPANGFDPLTGLPVRGASCGGTTTVPPIPNSLGVPDDSLKTLPGRADSGWVYFRTMAEIQFHPTATATQITSVLTKYRANIVGGAQWLTTYYIRYPDPGPSWLAVRGRIDSLAAEPGVKSVIPLSRIAPEPTLEARFPDDGQTLKRASWIAGTSDTTWASRAVRAPLAWGCETGVYGGASPRIGVIEREFQDNHPDLAASATTPVFRPIGSGGSAVSAGRLDTLRFHGTAMAGLLSASGDNNQGVAGMLWKSDLRLYSLGASSQFLSFSPAGTFAQSIQRASQDQVRILSLSIGVFTDRDTSIGIAQSAKLVELLRTFLDSTPGALIVKATGNSGGDLPAQPIASATLATSLGGTGLHAALMTLRLASPAYRDRIIFVTGTDPGNTRRTQTDFFTGGGTDIAAPAKDVAQLGLMTGLPGSPLVHEVVLTHGTSPATALVAGVAGQLLAMEPNLTPAQVKDYILRGAQVPRLSPSTGTYVAPPKVAGSPEVIFQLDAYGALSLLSKERLGTPICGVEVTLVGDPSFAPVSLRIARNSAEIIGLPSGVAGTFSVAQGGRLIAIDNFGDVATLRTLTGNQWVFAGTIPNVRRVVFTEQDTVYLRHVQTSQSIGLSGRNRGDLFVRVGSETASRRVAEFPVTAGLPDNQLFSAGWSAGPMPASPTGDWLVLKWGYSGSSAFCSPGSHSQDGLGTTYLWPLRGQQGAPTTLQSRTIPIWCGPPFNPDIPPANNDDDVAWNPAGNDFFDITHLKYPAGSIPETAESFQRWNLTPNANAPTGTAIQVNDIHFYCPVWAPTGEYFRTEESASATGAGPCYLRSRLVSSPGVLFGSSTLVSPQCFLSRPTPLIVRPSGRQATN